RRGPRGRGGVRGRAGDEGGGGKMGGGRRGGEEGERGGRARPAPAAAATPASATRRRERRQIDQAAAQVGGHERPRVVAVVLHVAGKLRRPSLEREAGQRGGLRAARRLGGEAEGPELAGLRLGAGHQPRQ